MINAEARFNKSLRPRKPEGSLGRTAQDVHLDSHTAPELSKKRRRKKPCASYLYLLHVYTVNSPGVAKALNVKFSTDNKAVFGDCHFPPCWCMRSTWF